MHDRSYQIGASTITIVSGDLVRSRAEVLVSSDDYMLSMGGGVSEAIRLAAGRQIEAEARKLVPVQAGDVAVTSGYKLAARYVFHAVTVGERHVEMPPDAIVRSAVRKAMMLMPLLGCRSIAFPVLGTGVAGIPFATAASEMTTAIVSALVRSGVALDVEIVLGRIRDEHEIDTLVDALERDVASRTGLEAHAEHEARRFDPPADDAATVPGDDARRRAQIHRMLTHLDMRRDRLEAELIDRLTGAGTGAGEDESALRDRLREIHALRAVYESELAGRDAMRPVAVQNSVFVSSTSADLQPHRDSLRGVIEKLGRHYIGMEDFAPTEQAPADLIRDQVESAEVYVGVIGMRYGYVEPGSGLSMTELEYRQAVASGKPIRIFLMDREARITAAMVETDPEAYAKLLGFRDRLGKAHTCAFFRDVGELSAKARSALEPGRH